ncbi:aminoglycoside phosphotransferase [Actinoplanes sp. N902-109]|nr:aminoglycoside phosphotransferase [Actinoplanes sp. N902-109]
MSAAAEAQLLRIVAEVSPLPVPEPVHVDDRLGCLAYRLLPGVPLLTLHPWPSRTVPPAPAVAARLGDLLAALHAIPPARLAGIVPVDDTPPEAWLDEARESWPALEATVPRAHRRAVHAFLAAEAPPPPGTLLFSHQDLGAEHVLVDPLTREPTGIIDWGDAAVGDPARDLGLILRDLGPAALRAVGPEPDAEERAHFYARCGLLADLAHGLETGRPAYVGKSIAALGWLFPAERRSPPG